jgi:dTDP-4-amino-4,6-dideoxygalactose transaminase
LRNGGQRERYRHESFGVNSRLDEMQAAILRVGLRHLPAWTKRRRQIAAAYSRGLADRGLVLPPTEAHAEGVAHLYAVRHPRRDALAVGLQERGISTLVHFPIPLHLQPAFAASGGRPGDLPVAEQAAREVLSLPLYPGLRDDEVERVIRSVLDTTAAIAGGGP